MLQQQLRTFKVYCHYCGITSRRLVQATDEETAKKLFLESHCNGADPRCQASRYSLTVLEAR